MPRPRPTPAPTPLRLGPSHHKLWAATAISTLGDGVYLAALPLLAAHHTHDPLQVATVTFAGWLPWLLVGLPAGALVDRWDRRRVMWTVDAARCLVVGALAAAVLAGWVSIPVLAVLAFLLGVGQTLFDNASQAIVPTIVTRDPPRLTRANSQLGAAQTSGRELAGPPLGGLLFALAAWAPFAADAASFASSSTLIAAIRGRYTPNPSTAPIPTGPACRAPGLRAQAIEGLRWLAGHRLLRTLAVMVGISNLVVNAGQAILVLFAQQLLGVGSVGYGLLLACFALGGLPGSLLVGPLGRRLPPGLLLVGGLLLQAAAMGVFGLTDNAMVAGVALAVGGFAVSVWGVTQVALRQSLVPDRLMGRVLGAARLVGYGLIPVGALLGGVLGRTLGLRAPFLLGAVVLAVLALLVRPVVNTRTIQHARRLATSC